MSRWVVVDDTDPDITYSGQWFLDQGTQNGLGNFGPPYLSTLHGTSSDSSFSYSFHGKCTTAICIITFLNVKIPIIIGTGTNSFWRDKFIHAMHR